MFSRAMDFTAFTARNGLGFFFLATALKSYHSGLQESSQYLVPSTQKPISNQAVSRVTTPARALA